MAAVVLRRVTSIAVSLSQKLCSCRKLAGRRALSLEGEIESFCNVVVRTTALGGRGAPRGQRRWVVDVAAAGTEDARDSHSRRCTSLGEEGRGKRV